MYKITETFIPKDDKKYDINILRPQASALVA